ncbi:MAG: HD domain-containing protein [Candidatus Thorarchaeota archaeon]
MMRSELELKLSEKVRKQTQATCKGDWIKAQQESQVALFDYRFDHIQEVVRIAKVLAINTGADLDVVVIASWLHDISKPGRNGPSNHGVVSADMAREILRDEGIDQDVIEKVCDAIVKHVGLTLDKPLTPIEAQIVWEADKLNKLGASGLLHYIIVGLQYNPGLSSIEIARDIREFIGLAERITASMDTPLAREIAKARLMNLKSISEMLDSELNERQEGSVL